MDYLGSFFLYKRFELIHNSVTPVKTFNETWYTPRFLVLTYNTLFWFSLFIFKF